MTLNYKYTILYTFVSLFLFLIVIKYGINTLTYMLRNNCPFIGTIKEGLTDFEKYSQKVIPYPKDATINYNDMNSPLYSHTVNLPINDPVSCKNFCGPNAKCLLTGEQCTSDIDCQGCVPKSKTQDSCITKEVDPYDVTLTKAIGGIPAGTVLPGMTVPEKPDGGFSIFEIDDVARPYPLNTSLFQPRGSILIFPSYIKHRVLPVTKGVRRSLVTWYNGPKFS